MKKINKTQARKLFNEGTEIMFAPSNYNINSPWHVQMNISNGDIDISFDEFVEIYKRMNCCTELGRRVSYYVKEENINE